MEYPSTHDMAEGEDTGTEMERTERAKLIYKHGVSSEGTECRAPIFIEIIPLPCLPSGDKGGEKDDTSCPTRHCSRKPHHARLAILVVTTVAVVVFISAAVVLGTVVGICTSLCCHATIPRARALHGASSTQYV